LQLSGFTDSKLFDAWVDDRSREEAEAVFTEQERESRLRESRDADARAMRSSRHETADAIVAATAAVLSIPVERLRSARRGQPEMLGRMASVQCAVAAGLSGSTIASALRLSPQRVSVIRRQQSSCEVVGLCRQVRARVGEDVGKWK